ncbi:MAG: HU family DNA-binding protein [Acidimicrobiia bacterium]
MNRRELVLALAERTETDRKTADAWLQAFIDVVTEAVAKGDPVRITGFAKFARVDRAARMGRNPATGETIRIKAKRVARITPLKDFKDAALTGKVAKKAPTKKTTARKPAAKKAAKRAPAKKTTARKPAAKKTAGRKPAAKKTTRRR